MLEDDGGPEAYAIYRLNFSYEDGVPTERGGRPRGDGRDRRRPRCAIWRYLLDIDWMARIEAQLLPLDHPLLLLAAEPGRLRFRVGDGIFLRLVDVGAALAARSFEGDDSLVLKVVDTFCPWNDACFTVRGEKTMEEPDLRLSVDTLALRIPRRLHVLAARAGRRGGGGFRGSARPRGCAFPHGPGALVPRDLLSFC